jgi:peptidyl-prolyl cis-trans isomerase D
MGQSNLLVRWAIRKFPVDDYARGLQNELRASEAQFGRVLSFSEAQAVGIPDRVLSRLVQEKALENEAAAISLVRWG